MKNICFLPPDAINSGNAIFIEKSWGFRLHFPEGRLRKVRTPGINASLLRWKRKESTNTRGADVKTRRVYTSVHALSTRRRRVKTKNKNTHNPRRSETAARWKVSSRYGLFSRPRDRFNFQSVRRLSNDRSTISCANFLLLSESAKNIRDQCRPRSKYDDDGQSAFYRQTI